MNQEKPKNYYSLNLTEGRIFIIFITILIIVCVVAFGVALIISNSRKANDVKVNLANEDNLNLNSQNFSYYKELDEDNKVDSFAKNNSENNNAKSSDNYKLEIQENKNVEKNNEIEIAKTDNNSNDTVKIDNSEVIYSSKYIDDSASNENTKKQTGTSITKKSTTKSVQQTKKEFEKRYIVQVGSYINKKTAEEISLFYQIQGYPAYITETINKEKTYYRLRVGPFKEKTVAEGYLANLKTSKYGDKSYISIVYL